MKFLIIGKENLSSAVSGYCKKTAFVSDLPGGKRTEKVNKETYWNNYRRVDKVLGEYINKIPRNGHFMASSPYILLTSKSKNIFNEMLKKNIQITALTNSLNSTDAVYVSSIFYPMSFRLVEGGANIYVYTGKMINEGEIYPFKNKLKKSRWGVHSKTYIFNEESFFIGTYNIDNRSSYFNSETGLFCENTEISRAVSNNIKKRMNHSYKIIGKKKAIDPVGNEADYLGDAPRPKRLLMKTIRTPSKFFQKLL